MMRYLLIAIVLAVAGCSADAGPRQCKDWIVEHYQTNIRAYEECRDLPNCELEKRDVWSYMDDKQKLEECEQYTNPPEVIYGD